MEQEYHADLLKQHMHIQELELLTDDLQETVQFYTDVLGLEQCSSNSKKASFKAGKSILTFVQSDHLQPQYHFAFNIPCNQIEEALTWISAKVTLINLPDDAIIADFKSWNAKAFYFYDNNENIVEFIARYDLENSSEIPFDSSSILSASEIGLVTDDPLAFADRLVAENHLPYFSKGTKSDNFVTVGNDHGLFIIVKTERHWYPTHQAAQKCWTKIRIKENGLVTELSVNQGNT